MKKKLNDLSKPEGPASGSGNTNAFLGGPGTLSSPTSPSVPAAGGGSGIVGGPGSGGGGGGGGGSGTEAQLAQLAQAAKMHEIYVEETRKQRIKEIIRRDMLFYPTYRNAFNGNKDRPASAR